MQNPISSTIAMMVEHDEQRFWEDQAAKVYSMVFRMTAEAKRTADDDIHCTVHLSDKERAVRVQCKAVDNQLSEGLITAKEATMAMIASLADWEHRLLVSPYREQIRNDAAY